MIHTFILYKVILTISEDFDTFFADESILMTFPFVKNFTEKIDSYIFHFTNMRWCPSRK